MIRRRAIFAAALLATLGGSAGSAQSVGVAPTSAKLRVGVLDLSGSALRIQMAQSGLDATTAAQRANASIAAGAQGALADSKAKGLGDIFGATVRTVGTQQEAAAQRRGRTAAVGSR